MIRNPNQSEAVGESARVEADAVNEGLLVGRFDDADPGLLVPLIILGHLFGVPLVRRSRQVNGLLARRNGRVGTADLVFFPFGQVCIGLHGLLPGTVVHGHVVRGPATTPGIDDQWFVTGGLTDPVAQLVDVLEESRVTHPAEEQQPNDQLNR